MLPCAIWILLFLSCTHWDSGPPALVWLLQSRTMQAPCSTGTHTCAFTRVPMRVRVCPCVPVSRCPSRVFLRSGLAVPSAALRKPLPQKASAGDPLAGGTQTPWGQRGHRARGCTRPPGPSGGAWGPHGGGLFHIGSSWVWDKVGWPRVSVGRERAPAGALVHGAAPP